MREEASPAGWTAATVSQLAQVATGSAPPPHSGVVPVMGANGKIGKTGRVNFQGGILIGRVGAAGATHYQQEPCWASDNVLTVTTKPQSADPRFLYWWLTWRNLANLASRTAQPLITQTQVRKLEISYPASLVKQRRIAEILDSVEESTRSTERLLDKLAVTADGTLRSLLGQLAGHTAESLEIMRPLGSIGRIRSGSTPSRALHSRYYANGNLPWVKTMDLNEDVLTSTDERITDAAVADYSCPILAPMTVLIAMYGGWAQIGRTAILGRTATINQAISAVEIHDLTVDPSYVQLALQLGRRYWKGIAASTRKDPNITRADVLAFEIPVPAIDKQRRIVAVSKVAKARIKAEQMKLAKLRRIKDGLMEDLLTGRVRVSVEGA
ncbi:restriction endonuclease subunit S [Micromonospora sp. NPDC023966]|uniref:restriction endonuclease subunit S n=1 Tax=Micromonospora sp. NPDC023966 TaxID=3154699 RepID=UPI0033C4551B